MEKIATKASKDRNIEVEDNIEMTKKHTYSQKMSKHEEQQIQLDKYKVTIKKVTEIEVDQEFEEKKDEFTSAVDFNMEKIYIAKSSKAQHE